ncbi:FAD-binding oxidoreductase, partial [bacterium]|nr:FAD-binding oxidoreductase [bacterium]
MRSEFDAIVIGGGIVGMATAYNLAKMGRSVLVLEKGYIGSGSTGRCITGIRAQFSTETSIRLAMRSVSIFRKMETMFGFSVEWAPSGYLFLAFDDARKKSFLNVLKIQQDLGLDVDYLEARDIGRKYPYLNTRGLVGGTFCSADGQADPFHVLKGYFLGLKKMGAEVRTYTEVTAVDCGNVDMKCVHTASGMKFSAPIVINAAGPWANPVSQMAGIKLPVFSETHEAMITEPVQYQAVPMVVDYRNDGCYFVQRLTGQFVGCYSPDPQVPGYGLETTLDFLREMSRRMIRLMPFVENTSVVRQWAGLYSMTPDGNPIVDETTIPGYFVAVGMSGHG